LLACTAVLLLFAAPASASHLKGGSISAAIGSDQHLTGHVELIYRSVAACPAAAAQLGAGSVQVSGPSAFSASAPITGAVLTACLPSTKTEGGEFGIDLSGAPDGTYTATYTLCCRVTPIVNVAGGAASTSYTATVHKSGSTVTATPSLTSNVALGISTHARYAQNLNATSSDGGPLTYTLLQGSVPAQADYDATAPTSNIVSLDAAGQVAIPSSTTSGLVVGTAYVYKVRVATAAGDSAEREVLLTVSANNVPVLVGPQSPVAVAAGTTTTLHFTATDPDGAQLVTILPAGLPAWAALSATAGNPADATITLTPPAGTTAQLNVNVDATDNDGTAPMTDSRSLILNVAPLVLETTLGAVPAAASNDPLPTVAFTGDPPEATFECSLDDGAWTPCVSPWSPAASLPDGPHTLRVRALLGDQTQPDPVSTSWTTDTTAPDAPALLGPPSGTATSAAITFSGEPGATFSCRLDGADWAPCVSPQRYAGLAAGAHSAQVRQADAVGNMSSPATVAWTVTTAEAPATPAAPATAKRLAVLAPAAIVAASDRPSVRCRAIGGPLTSCTVRAYVQVTGRNGKKVRVLVGRGRVGAVAAGASAPVRLTLTARGRRLLSRVGGVKVQLSIAGRGTSGQTLRASDEVRLLPEQTRVVSFHGRFAPGSAWLSASERRSVRRLERDLDHVKTIVCTGYTDSLGSSAYNERLALARAKAVCAVLHSQNRKIAVRARSAGEDNPLATNRTAAGRAENRRVELRLRYR
jgi:outer membrane protein OmpA-like peptidoglycan-associated protein